MTNIVYLLEESTGICGKLNMVWTIFRYIILGIQIVVPLLLIITSALSFAKAITKEKDDDIKKAQDLLIKRIIAAVLVFLTVFITKTLVRIVINSDDKASWEICAECALNPFNDDCGIQKSTFVLPE